MVNEKLITVEELAAKLNVPVSWVYQRTRRGTKAIPFIKVGKHIRFDIDEVIEFLRKNSQEQE